MKKKRTDYRTEYALYKGDNLLAIGRANEIAEAMGVTTSTILFYKSPTYKKRSKSKNTRVLIPLDDE